MPRKGQTIPPEERFWAMVDVSEPDSCWLWLGSKNHKGYGMFRWYPGKNPIGAHRASWTIVHGAPQGDFHVLHSCHNPACVNPSHLRLGTNAENMADRTADGNTARGESSGRAKLSREDVISIRTMYKSGKYTQKELGELFNISRTNIGNIVRLNSWRHLLKEK